MTARSSLLAGGLAAAVGLGAGACSAPAGGDFHGEEPEPIGEVALAATVEEAVGSGCSTTAVWGLGLQIIEQMNCLIPGGALAAVPDRPSFVKGSATLAYMQPPAVDALVAALDENAGTTLTCNSMLRTVAQQYLLYRWYQTGACGISLAATPGNSNHESGLAVDVSQYSTWRPLLEAHGFSWLGSNDPVHFDYAGFGAVDLSGKDVLAFQMLWNLNHPGDAIVEDGDYGPATEARLQQSPADGFPVPPTCGSAGTGGGGAGGTGAGGTSAGGVAGAAGTAAGAGSGGDGGSGWVEGGAGSGAGGTAAAGAAAGSGGTPIGTGGAATGGSGQQSQVLGGDDPGCACATATPARDAAGASVPFAALLLAALPRLRARTRRRA